MVGRSGAPKQYSGWVFVAVGAVVAVGGALIILGLALGGYDFPDGRRTGAVLLFSVPLGLALVVFGLVSVIRRKPVVDDGGAQRADFRRRNSEALRRQKEERRRAQDEKRQLRAARISSKL